MELHYSSYIFSCPSHPTSLTEKRHKGTAAPGIRVPLGGAFTGRLFSVRLVFESGKFGLPIGQVSQLTNSQFELSSFSHESRAKESLCKRTLLVLPFCDLSLLLHKEKTFCNLVNSNQNQMVVTIFGVIRIQTDVRLDLIQSENGKYNLISG